jgi:hypothetical protein
MKTESLSGHSGVHELYQYKLVVEPDAEVCEKVMTEKLSFCNEYESTLAIETGPHITIAEFVAYEAMEDTIIRWMQRICSRQGSFAVTLNN